MCVCVCVCVWFRLSVYRKRNSNMFCWNLNTLLRSCKKALVRDKAHGSIFYISVAYTDIILSENMFGVMYVV